MTKPRKASEAYLQKLKDPQWQQKRLRIMERDRFMCQNCEDTKRPQAVHHRWYEYGRDPWDYPDEALVTLCDECHGFERESRQRVEQDLLRLLKRHFLYAELHFFLLSLERMPPEVLHGLALGSIHPGHWWPVEQWLVERRERHTDERETYEGEIAERETEMGV